MPYITTHVLASIIAIELFRKYYFKDNKKFLRYYILIAAIAGVFPDIEYLFLLSFKERYFLHSIFIPIIFLLFGLFAMRLNVKNKYFGMRHMNMTFIFFVFSAGSLIHIILDSIFIGTLMPFYPFSDFKIGLELVNKFPNHLQELVLSIVDGILLFFWLIWMQFKLKVDDFFSTDW